MKKSVDFDFDDHPSGDSERPVPRRVISVVDDCDGCNDLRVEVTLEEEGRQGTGVTAHLAPATARRRAGVDRGRIARDRRTDGLTRVRRG